MFEVSRQFEFQAAHHLPEMPAGHKCRRLHGHTWICRVWVAGSAASETGIVVDYADIEKAWIREVYAVLDHTLLNDTVPNPTTENVAAWIYARMANAPELESVHVSEIELSEGSRNWTRLRVQIAQLP